jgi:hypothetical protein
MDNSAPISTSAPARRGKTPALVNTALIAALVLVLTTLALQASQSPPPAIAEFAPQVQQQIKQAPQNQGGEQGAQAVAPTPTPPPPSGHASAPPSAAAASPSPTPLSVPQNEVKHCVGNPPRQTEDSQSPPCVAYWPPGDNGGATDTGVTKDSIYVSLFTGQGPSQTVREFEDLRRYFNQRFELYGRQLVFEYCAANQNAGGYTSSQGASDAAAAYAGCSSGGDASAAAYGAPTGHVPFAMPGYQSNYFTYDKVSACNDHAITVVGGTLAEAYMRSPSNCFPNFWQYAMSNENIFSMTGQWVCARLAGSVAHFATGLDGKTVPGQLNQDPRKFGLIVSDIGEGAGDPTATPEVYGRLLSELKVCGVDIAQQDMLVEPPATSPQSYTTSLVQMKQDNVTSVLCMAVFGDCIAAQKTADTIPYFPEWVSTTFSAADSDLVGHLLPADQRAHTFGLSFIPKTVRPQLDPWYQAIQSVDPSDSLPTDAESNYLIRIQYWDLLELVSGIQMAGPHLTSEAFANALWNTRFPNPSTSLYEGKVGFSGQSLEMTTDAAEIFWSNTSSGPYTDSGPSTGVVCYVNHGLRTSAGQWQKGSDSGFFTSSCDSGA